jgi:hypothetical protein
MGGRERSSSRPPKRIEVIDSLSQVLLLARFLCFMAVVYLALHKIVAGLSKKPNSKLLWFFAMITAPLTRPVRAWITPSSTDKQLLSRSLLFYGFLWLCFIVLGRTVNLSR